MNWTYAYNPSTQLTNVTRSNDLYAWNGHFNVIRAYGTNGLNQLTSAGGTALGYDTRGNLTSSGATAYGYTVENRLKSVSGAMTAHYDTLGRLAEYNTSISTRFLYDGDRVTAELDNQGTVNPVKRRYIWGAGADELVAWYEGIGSATRRFPVQDERASIVAVSDSAGALVGINRYDEYGIPASTNIGRFQYTGQAFLAEAGLHHYKARAYSPTLGRFLQTDPIGYGDGINWYDYVDGDPVNRSDPDGMAGCTPQTGTNICSPAATAATAATSIAAREGIGAQNVRSRYNQTVAKLAANDSAGRSAAKASARAATPPITRGVIGAMRPGLGPKPGSGGTANRTNVGADRLAGRLGNLGRAAGVAGAVVGAARIASADNPGQEAARVGAGITGALAGAEGGAFIGAFAGPVGAAVGGVVGGIAGGFLGEKAVNNILGQ